MCSVVKTNRSLCRRTSGPIIISYNRMLAYRLKYYISRYFHILANSLWISIVVMGYSTHCHHETMTLENYTDFFTLKTHKNHTKIFTKETALIITLKYFPWCSRTLKSHWKKKSHFKFSVLLISLVPRIFSVTLDFQCDFSVIGS